MHSALITTPFGPTSTAAEVIAGVDLAGRRAVVTGASSGIGRETARVLAAAGAEVTLAVRDVAAGQRAAAGIEDWLASVGYQRPAGLHVAPLDLADQASVAAFVLGWHGPLHILVNNAGVMATPELRTPEGWELQFATNHLGHFALATGLRASLAAGAGSGAGPGPGGTARVVSVSSLAHVIGGLELDDVNFERRPYSPFAGYAQSKTANVLFAVAAARRWAGDGIAVNAVHPGRIVSTDLYRHVDPAAASGGSESAGKDIPQGAATQVLLAASPLVEGVTGKYFEDCQEAAPFVPGGPRRGVADFALDPGQAARLWELSERMLAAG